MNLPPPSTLSIYWDLPIMIVIVSLVYSATRYDDWPSILHEALTWGLRMVLFLGGIGLALYFVGWWIDSRTSWWVLALAGVGAALFLFAGFFRPSKKKTTA